MPGQVETVGPRLRQGGGGGQRGCRGPWLVLAPPNGLGSGRAQEQCHAVPSVHPRPPAHGRAERRHFISDGGMTNDRPRPRVWRLYAGLAWSGQRWGVGFYEQAGPPAPGVVQLALKGGR